MPDSLTSIGDWAFEGCSGLTSVTIPSSVTRIGSSAFSGCSGLMEIIVESGNPEFITENGLLLSRDGKTLMQGVNGVVSIPSCVTNIGSDAFFGYSGLTRVTIPSSVTSIGDRAFHDCSDLTNVTIPDSVTSIGFGAFGGCSGLTSVTMLGKTPSAYSTLPNGDWPIYVTEAWDGPSDTWQGHPVKLVRDSEVTVVGKDLYIPGAWMAQYPSVAAAAADDAGSAVEAVAANGRKVWECYALGLDPEKADEDFKIVLFPMKADGTPDVDNIVFDPPREKWNAQGACAVLQGASELGGEWRAVTEENKASFRFFKVVVELP